MEEATAIYQPDAQVGELKLWRPPDLVVAEAKQAADTLRRIIDGSDNKPVKFGDKEHLKHEHWEILGHFFGYAAKIESTKYIEFDGPDRPIRGYEAYALLLNERTGAVVGRAEAMCLDDEENWGDVAKYEWQDRFDGQGKKTGREKVQVGTVAKPLFQIRSMAQTRATAKAFRNKLAWVAVLAGYKPTPAEEMDEQTAQREAVADPLPTELKRKPLTPSYDAKIPQPSNGDHAKDQVRSHTAEIPTRGETQPTSRRAGAGAVRPSSTSNGRTITDAQSRRFYALWREAGKTRAQVTEYLQEQFGIEDDRKIPMSGYEAACQWAQNG